MQSEYENFSKVLVPLCCVRCGDLVFSAYGKNVESWTLGNYFVITSCCNGPCCSQCEKKLQESDRMQCPLCGTLSSKNLRIRKDKPWKISPLSSERSVHDVSWINWSRFRHTAVTFQELVETQMPQFPNFLKWLRMKRIQNQRLPTIRWYKQNEDLWFYYQIASQEDRICLLFRHTLLMSHPHSSHLSSIRRFQFGICSSEFYRDLEKFKSFPMVRILSRSNVPFIRMLAMRFSNRMMFWILMRIFTRRILEIQADSLRLIQ